MYVMLQVSPARISQLDVGRGILADLNDTDSTLWGLVDAEDYQGALLHIFGETSALNQPIVRTPTQ